MTVNVLPATVSVPTRTSSAVLAATVKSTVPFPIPDAPAVTVIHELLLAAVHAQPAAVVTAVLPVPPAAGSDWLAGEIVYEHAAACVTVNVLPAAVSVPVRIVPAVLAATVNATVPFPDPDAPPVTVIHVLLLVAVHAQPAAVVTALLPVPPAAGSDWLAGEIVYEHAAACVTVNVLPAAVSVPVRIVPAVLAATVNATVPFPDRDAPPVTVIHVLLLVAVHAHPAAVVTALLPVPPAAGSDWLAGEIVYEHAAACVTVNVLPAAVSVPVRIVPAVLAATVNATVPFPDPDAPPVTVIHVLLLVAVHAHPAAVVTALLPVPPAAGSDWLAGEIVYEHAAACVTVNVLPAAVSVPVRIVPAVLAATVNATVPFPDPDARQSR